jgi:uncharacterized protein (DUF885 family)
MYVIRFLYVNHTMYFSSSWPRDRAIEYMLNYTAYSRKEMTTEIDRYITWPGQACAYKTGELKIHEVRRKAETELGKTL